MLPLVPPGKSSFLFSTTTGSLHHCKTPGLQQCQITSVAAALCITLHFHPVVLMSFTTTSSLLFQLVFLSHQIFSPVHSAATATFLHTGQSEAEAGGNSWERPCISCCSPTYSHCTTFSVCDKQLYCSIRNIFKSGLHCTLGYAKNLHCFILRETI